MTRCVTRLLSSATYSSARLVRKLRGGWCSAYLSARPIPSQQHISRQASSGFGCISKLRSVSRFRKPRPLWSEAIAVDLAGDWTAVAQNARRSNEARGDYLASTSVGATSGPIFLGFSFTTSA
jgi:hypothetical protein